MVFALQQGRAHGSVSHRLAVIGGIFMCDRGSAFFVLVFLSSSSSSGKGRVLYRSSLLLIWFTFALLLMMAC